MRSGFTLVELLIVVVLLGLLIGLAFFPTAAARKKANLLAGQSYVRSVATELEARRDPLTGALPTGLTDCTTGFGERPRTVSGCSIAYPDPVNFVIEATLEGAALGRVVYQSQTGALTSLP